MSQFSFFGLCFRSLRGTVFLVVLIGMVLPVCASHDPIQVGGRATALGYAYVGVRGDVWSLAYNPAAITGGKGLQTGLYLEQGFLQAELSYGHAAATLPFFGNQAAGIEISSFGFKGYRENMAALSYGITVLEKISIGAKFAYTNLNIPGYGTTGTFLMQVGVHTQLTPQLSLGMSAYNVNRAQFDTQGRQEVLPTLITAGLAYQPSDKVLIVVDVQKTELYPISFRGGIEYQLHRLLYARVGVSTEPLSFHGGMGLKWQQLSIDVAASYTELLGYTPRLSLQYRFGGE